MSPSGVCLPIPCLMLVSDRALCPDIVGAVQAALPAAVDAVQLREKDPDGRSLPLDELLPLAHRLREATRGRALLLVNGSLEVALAAGADGVHLPEAAPAIERPRSDFLVGRSVHSLDAARRAEAEGADYLIVGPVYETRSHPGAEPAGPALIEEVAQAVRIPALAIGGITAERVQEVVRVGAAGVAVISAVLASPAPAQATRDLRKALDAAWAEAERSRRARALRP